MSGRERLTQTEQYLAYLTGLGITLIIIGLLLIGLGTVDDGITNSMILVGFALTILGIGAWLYLVKPWERFDDLKTPYYTGHEAEAPPQETAEDLALDEAVPAAGKASAPVDLAVTEEKPAAAEPVAVAEPPAPVIPAAKPDAQANDLTLLEGIGPKTAAALNKAGIITFDQVAAMTPDDLITTARAHGARVNKADTWPEQAKEAAEADISTLRHKQEQIKGGEQYDDLTEIEGVGPKSKEVLHAAGVRTFEDLASATPDDLRAKLEAGGLNTKLVKPDTWPEQAKLIVSGDLTALKQLQDELKGGRR